MNRGLAFLFHTFIDIPIMVTVWLVSFLALEQTFLMSAVFSIAGGVITFFAVKGMTGYRYLKKHQLTRKESKYIQKNLDEAKKKITRLHKALLSIRNLTSLKQNIDMIRVTRKIYKITKKEPRRFYKAEKFYFYHLDSLVELSEKHVFLSSQPKKNAEIDQSLYETRRTLEELSQAVEKDLYEVLSDDIDQLNFEIDVAKHSIKNFKDSQFHDESRRLK